MKTIVVPIPDALKAKLDELRAQGYTINGYVRAMLERELAHQLKAGRSRKGRRTQR